MAGRKGEWMTIDMDRDNFARRFGQLAGAAGFGLSVSMWSFGPRRVLLSVLAGLCGLPGMEPGRRPLLGLISGETGFSRRSE